MSIVKLKKVTFVGLVEEKGKVLEDLQDIGCLHLIPVAAEKSSAPGEAGPSPKAQEALKFLLEYSHRWRQSTLMEKFDPVKVEKRSLEIKQRLLDLQDEKDFLVERIENLSPWGEFEFPPAKELKNLKLWFYIVPHQQMKEIETGGLSWVEVNRDNRFRYIVIISETEPERMPVPRVRTGDKSRRELEERLEDVEMEIEDLQSERGALSRWILLFIRNLNRLEDSAALAYAKTFTCDLAPLFALQGWSPADKIDELDSYASQNGIVIEVRMPDPGEEVPTQLDNPPAFRGGENLVTFYQTPGYWTWDPSSVVFVSFALFFAMILSDAGYGALLGAILALNWQKMGRSDSGRRWRGVFASLVGASIVWGALVGGYFGVSPSPGSFLGKLKVFDMNDTATMMPVAIVIGMVHIALANLMDAIRLGRVQRALAPFGWTIGILGVALLVAGKQFALNTLANIGAVVLAGGLLLAFLFSGAGKRPLKRLFSGFGALTKIPSLFGDVLSYLRLFALGLASGALAMAFNNLASEAKGESVGFGLLLALLILLIGHGLNFLLAIVGGFVHGLRLNVIEFFKYGLTEEGHAYFLFKRNEEDESWNF